MLWIDFSLALVSIIDLMYSGRDKWEKIQCMEKLQFVAKFAAGHEGRDGPSNLRHERRVDEILRG